MQASNNDKAQNKLAHCKVGTLLTTANRRRKTGAASLKLPEADLRGDCCPKSCSKLSLLPGGRSSATFALPLRRCRYSRDAADVLMHAKRLSRCSRLSVNPSRPSRSGRELARRILRKPDKTGYGIKGIHFSRVVGVEAVAILDGRGPGFPPRLPDTGDTSYCNVERRAVYVYIKLTSDCKVRCTISQYLSTTF